jgi:hypothetical protein
MPEVSERDLLNRYDGVQISKAKISEKEMSWAYKLADHPNFNVPNEYRDRLAARVDGVSVPLAGPDGADRADLEKLKQVLFDKVEPHHTVPSDTESGKVCARPIFATASINEPDSLGKMVLKLFPLFERAAPETKEWLLGHESGHALSNIVDLEGDINKLPSWQRATILMQLEAFQEYLANVGKPVNGVSTGTEAIADAFSYFLRDPGLLKDRAPAVYALIVDQIQHDDILRKLIRVS